MAFLDPARSTKVQREAIKMAEFKNVIDTSTYGYSRFSGTKTLFSPLFSLTPSAFRTPPPNQWRAFRPMILRNRKYRRQWLLLVLTPPLPS